MKSWLENAPECQPPIRYVHNLLILHFNVGENVAFCINYVMRNQLNLCDYCITRAKQCTPYYRSHNGTYRSCTFFCTAEVLHRFMKILLEPNEICFQFRVYKNEFEMQLMAYPFVVALRQKTYGMRTKYTIVQNQTKTRVSELEFHQQIDVLFHKFMSYPANPE